MGDKMGFFADAFHKDTAHQMTDPRIPLVGGPTTTGNLPSKPDHDHEQGTIDTDGVQEMAKSVQFLTGLVKEQTDLLREMNKRQAESDLTRQPIPPVPARSTSAWHPLLKSALENIEPTVERWRGGLDTLLIFVGLFSAIVTAFVVNSLESLKPSDTARTNELLANLTEIIISINGASVSTASPQVFKPDPNDVRLNVYWSLSLILSLSTAALAVAGRGFLALLTCPDGDAVMRLTDLHQRWKGATKLLGPFLETLPQILVIPVMLFVMGLLDNLFSSSLQLPQVSQPVLGTAILACTFAGAVGVVLCGTIAHGCINPTTSPFQTTLSQNLCSLRSSSLYYNDVDSHKSLTPADLETFHLVLQETYADEPLDQAAAALEAIMLESKSHSISDLELKTLLHLLSPEASYRSNLTVASAIAHLGVSNIRRTFNKEHRANLIHSLLRAVEHTIPHSSSGGQLWDSIFIKAIATLILTERVDHSYYTQPPRISYPLVVLMSANYFTQKYAISPRLVLAHSAASSFACSLFIPKLLAQNSIKDWLSKDTMLDQAILTLLGPCKDITYSERKQLIISFLHAPALLRESNFAFWRARTGLIQWLLGNDIMAMTLDIVQSLDIDSNHQSPLEVEKFCNLMRIVQYACFFESSAQSLMICVKFILRAQGKAGWTYAIWLDHKEFSNIISTFLTLVLDQLHWPKPHYEPTHLALSYVYQWALYETNPTMNEFIRRERDQEFNKQELLQSIEPVWKKVYDSEYLLALASENDCLFAALIPLPRPSLDENDTLLITPIRSLSLPSTLTPSIGKGWADMHQEHFKRRLTDDSQSSYFVPTPHIALV